MKISTKPSAFGTESTPRSRNQGAYVNKSNVHVEGGRTEIVVRKGGYDTQLDHSNGS